MPFQAFIIHPKKRMLSLGQIACLFFLMCGLYALQSFAQNKIAFIAPEDNRQSQILKEKLADEISKQYSVVDSSLAEVAFKSAEIDAPYNLSTEHAKNLAVSIGCDFFVLLKAENLRRSSTAKPSYYESYVAVYLVSAKTGRLVFWDIRNFESETPEKADEMLYGSITQISEVLSKEIDSSYKTELSQTSLPKLEILPEQDSPEAQNFRSPLPYKRFRPAYTIQANLYGVAATVDAEVDLDEKGNISRTEITRWAGFGLDEAVIETIRKMNWRPAERDGKTLPIRVLLRYNFKKITEDEQ